MQAVGIGLPVLNLKSLAAGRAEAFPAQDLFQSLLQERIGSRHLNGRSSSATALNRTTLKSQLREARPSKSTSPLLSRRQSLSDRSSVSSSKRDDRDPIPTKITRKLIDRTDKSLYSKSQENSAAATETADSSSAESWKANLRSRTLRLAQESSQKTNPSAAVAAAPTQVEMPPALQGLIEFLNQQPNQSLQVPADRLPEVKAFLLKAGISAEQVQNLLTSPRFQEQGLNAQDLQTAWVKTAQTAVQENAAALDTKVPLTSKQFASLQARDITKQADYQQMWQDLTLPAQALPNLRLELQQLGVSSEALATLNEQNFPQGIPLSQVWQIIKDAKPAASASAAADAATLNAASNSPRLLNGDQDLAKWREMLVQAGMDPELAQAMASNSSPTTREELRTDLLKMAPAPSSPADLTVPKPLYLPESVRLQTFPLLQQQQAHTGGQGNGGDSGNWAQNFGFSAPTQEGTLTGNTDLNNFLAILHGGSPLKAADAAAAGVAGQAGSSVNALLTPEAREALWAQVQKGILGNLQPGENQVTLTLSPPELGKLHLTLNVRGEMVEVTAVTSHAAVAEAGTAGVQQLAQALSQQGLTLTQFQFHHQDEAAKGQTQFAFSQNSGDQRQAGKKDDADTWEQPSTPRRRRGNGGVDCFA